MPSVYASTACIRGTEPLFDRIERYRRAGIRGIELGAGVRVAPGDLDRLRDGGGPFLIHNYFPPPPIPFFLNLASGSPDVRERSIAHVKETLRLSAALGAELYSVHAGFITDPSGFGETSFIFPSPGSPEEERVALMRFVASLREVLPVAAETGVDLLLENNACSEELRGKLLLQRTEEFQEFFALFDHPRLKILLDTGHLNVSAHALGFDRLHFVRILGERIAAVHLHDNDGRTDQHKPPASESWVFEALALLPEAAVITEATFADASDIAEHLRFVEEKCVAAESSRSYTPSV
jgi:sugar phosphate isomerase/epimerase